MLFVILLGSFKHVVEPVIPEESFRFRIIANSNSSYDQEIKMHVRSLFNQKLSTVMSSASSISETKETISAMLPDLERIFRGRSSIFVSHLTWPKLFSRKKV